MATKQYRLPVEVIDLSGFPSNQNNQIGAMVLKPEKVYRSQN